MDMKKFYMSKTFWASLVLMVYGFGTAVIGGELSYDSVMAILVGFGIFGLRDAIDKAESRFEE